MVVKKLINSIMGFVMLVSCLGPSMQVHAIDSLPLPDQILSVSAQQKVPLLRGLKINPEDPFDFKFIVDSPDSKQVDQIELNRLFDYFLTSLTLKDDKFWVNLSPNEKNRIIDDNLAVTQMGKDMLEQDYLLKQLSSSLTDPETQLGSKYWNLVGAQHAAPENSKIWIESEGAELFEHKDVVVINDMSLNVTSESEKYKPLLEEISNDVNNGSNFSRLRQLHSAFILATWFKNKFVDSFYKSYIDQNKLAGLEKFDASHKFDVFGAYLKSYRNGVYKKNIKVTSDTGLKQKRNYCVGGVRLHGEYKKVDSFTKFSSPVSIVDTRLNTSAKQSSSLTMPELSREIKLLFKRIKILNIELLKFDGSAEGMISFLYNSVLDDLVSLKQALKEVAEDNGITKDIFVLESILDELDAELPSVQDARMEGLSDDQIKLYALFESFGHTIEHFVKIQELPNDIDELLVLFDLYHKKLKSEASYGGKESESSKQKDMLVELHALQEFGKNLEKLSYIYEKLLMLGYGRDDTEKAKLDQMLMFAFVTHICSYGINFDEDSSARRFEAIEELSKIFYRGTTRVRQFLFEELIKDEGMYDTLIKGQLKAKNKKIKKIKHLEAKESQALRNEIKVIKKQIKGYKVIERLFFSTLELTYITLHEDELDQFVAFVFMQLKKAASDKFEFIANDSVKNTKVVIELIKSIKENFKKKSHLVVEQFEYEREELKATLSENLFDKLESKIYDEENDESNTKQSSSIWGDSKDSEPYPIFVSLVLDNKNAIRLSDKTLLEFWYELFRAIYDESGVIVNILHNGEKYPMGNGLFNIYGGATIVERGDVIRLVLEGESRRNQSLARELLEEALPGRKNNLKKSYIAEKVVPRYLERRLMATLDRNINNAFSSGLLANGGIEFKSEIITTTAFDVPQSFSFKLVDPISELRIDIGKQQVLMPEDSYLLFN